LNSLPELNGTSKNQIDALPLVAILLCTFNGERFLSQQLDSLENQTHKHWKLIVSDDGSTDSTLEILKEYQSKWGSDKLVIRRGPQKGFCINFLSLACDSSINADYYAFCDQDDVWLPEKLQISLQNILSHQEIALPYVYCGRTTYVDEVLNPCGISPLFVFPTTFRNALVQSIAGGNTMVFNQALKKILDNIGPLDVPSHDWWLYIVTTGCGGTVFYDPNPYVLYRQHEDALVGGNTNFQAKLERLYMVLKGRFKSWNESNINALHTFEKMLLRENVETLHLFETLRKARFKDRIRLIEVVGLYRQTRKGTLSLYMAALINKI
jgi:glycosyltransferase involved in cell wall biosynthesis